MEEQELVGIFNQITFGEEQSNDIYLTSLMVQPEFTSFTTNKSDLVFTVPMAGEHNAMNAMAALAIGDWLKVSPEQVKLGLKQMVPTGMRMEMVKTTNGLSIINDAYNASPTSMRAAIAYFAQLKGYRRKFIVLGDMLELGPEAEGFHREIGKSLHPDVADAVFTYGEQALWIADEAKANFAENQVVHFNDHATIAEQLNKYANEKDMILIKASRGMKMEQIIAHLNK
jgi:UDP-N-acetylmuramoyl-tripeptide--D-alanyl-D-alanine ligase